MILLPITIFTLTFGAVALLSWQLYPTVTKGGRDYHTRRIEDATKRLDAMFLQVPNKKRLALIYILCPLALGIIAFILAQNWLIAGAASGLGLILPTAVIKGKQAQRKGKFQGQLVDGLMILTSSLRGGLSLLQSIEVLVEEMPVPLSEEFGLVLREHKMGVSLEESLERLNKRMRSHHLNLITTAILLARETGGDITEVFGRIVESIRETSKVMEKVKTLTLQGKLQGIIMSILPIVFGVVVYTTNPGYLNIMFEHPVGKTLLALAITLEVIGSFLIWRMSRIDV